MKKLLVLVALAYVSLFASSAKADLIAYFNFNTLSIPTASAPGAGGVPTSIAANSGAGTVSLAGWTGLVDDFGGSTINALNSDPSEESLSLVSNAGNGSFVQLQVSLAGWQDPVITFATRGTTTGFNSGVWSWSTDGVNFNSLAGNTATTSTTFGLATADFTAVSGLTNASTAFFRYTLSGATNTSGNNRIDNLQLNASVAVVPEPSSMVLLALAGTALVGFRRRR